jgi:hypothetical protein
MVMDRRMVRVTANDRMMAMFQVILKPAFLEVRRETVEMISLS